MERAVRPRPARPRRPEPPSRAGGNGTRLVGVISDTHGLVRAQAAEALRGVEMILHAGDIGTPEVIEALVEIAPVRAIRGNNDTGPWARAFPETDVVEIGGMLLYLVHDVRDLDLDPGAAGIQAVISGHSHQPGAERKANVLYLNPGSAGPRRFRLPVSVARLRLRDGSIEPEIVTLDV